MELVGAACKRSLERKTIQLAPIINLINRLAEPSIEDSLNTDNYPKIEVLPQANWQRYERLRYKSPNYS